MRFEAVLNCQRGCGLPQASPRAPCRDHMTSAATRILRARGHFEVLGLPREQCTSAAVRAQFTKLVKEVHPDKCSHLDAAAAFRRLQAANDALKATGSRTRHSLREQRRRPTDRAPSRPAGDDRLDARPRRGGRAASCWRRPPHRLRGGRRRRRARGSPRAAGARADARAACARLLVGARLPYEGHSKEVIGAKVAAGLEKAGARDGGDRPWRYAVGPGGQRRWPGRSASLMCLLKVVFRLMTVHFSICGSARWGPSGLGGGESDRAPSDPL